MRKSLFFGTMLFAMFLSVTTFVGCGGGSGGPGSGKVIATYEENTGVVGATIKFYDNETFLIEHVTDQLKGTIDGNYSLSSDNKKLTLTVKNGTEDLKNFVASDVDVPFVVRNGGKKIKITDSTVTLSCPCFVWGLEYELKSGELISGSGGGSSGSDDDSDDGTTSTSGAKWGEGDTTWYTDTVKNSTTFQKEHLIKALLDAKKARETKSTTDLYASYTYYDDDFYGTANTKTVYFEVKSDLEKFTIPDRFTRIGYVAFSNQTWLKSIVIPSSIRYIDEYAFDGCELNTIDFGGDIETWCEISICYALKRDSNKPSKLLFSGTEQKDLNIPNTVTEIRPQAFYNCTNFTSVYIPSSVAIIGEKAFWGCTGLTNVTFALTDYWQYVDSRYGNWATAYIYNDSSTVENLIGKNGCSQDWTYGGMRNTSTLVNWYDFVGTYTGYNYAISNFEYTLTITYNDSECEWLAINDDPDYGKDAKGTIINKGGEFYMYQYYYGEYNTDTWNGYSAVYGPIDVTRDYFGTVISISWGGSPFTRTYDSSSASSTSDPWSEFAGLYSGMLDGDTYTMSIDSDGNWAMRSDIDDMMSEAI